eukprot:gene3044-595_t
MVGAWCAWPFAVVTLQAGAVAGTPTLVFTGHGANDVFQADWKPDGTEVVSGGADGTAQIWDPATGTVRLSYTSHGHPPPPSGGPCTAATAVDLTCPYPPAPNGLNAVHTVKWSPDGTKVASGDSSGLAMVWQASDGSLVTSFSGHS